MSIRWPWTRPAPALTDSRRLDAESEMLLRVTSSPEFTRRLDATVRGLWGSELTGVGGTSDPLSSLTIQGIQPLDDLALASLTRDPLALRCCSEIPEAISAAGHIVTCPEAPSLPDLARRLDLDERFREADQLARQYRGAGILIRVVEDGHPPLSEPLDPDRVRRIISLDVYDGLALQPIRWQTGAERDHHPLFDADARPGDPSAYRLQATGTTYGLADEIHWTRVIPFWGVRIPPGARGLIFTASQWQSLSILDLCYEALRRYASTQRNGERIAASTGVFVGEVENFNSLQTGKDAGASGWGGWMSVFKSMLAKWGMILGPKGTTLSATSIPLAGWKDLATDAQMAIVAASGIPAPRMFSTPPPGLSTDASSWFDQWDETTHTDWKQRWKPGQSRIYRLEAYRQTRRILTPELTRGPLRLPTPAEQMALRVQGATEAKTLADAGIDVSAQVARDRYGARGYQIEIGPPDPAPRADAAPSREATLIALEIDPAAIAATLSAVRRVVPSLASETWPHVTLLYLGDIPSRSMPAIERGAAPFAELWPAELEPDFVGPLGDEGAIVLFLRRAGLGRVQDRMLRTLAPQVREQQFPRFLPHITLGTARVLTDEQTAALEALPAPERIERGAMVLRRGDREVVRWGIGPP